MPAPQASTPQSPASPKSQISARSTAASADPLLGREFGGLVLIGKLGQGGMGAVYEARQLSLDRSVAVKVLPAHLADDPEYLVRFTREALAAARLDHHNVVQILDVGEADGLHYFSMELVRGETLQHIRKREGPFAPEQAAGYILQAARGLQYAHERGIVHRDIKPANLMLNDQGLIKVADLGLAKQSGLDESQFRGGRAATVGTDDSGESLLSAKLTSTRNRSESFLSAELTTADATVGTMGFMSPEQCADARTVDGRSDIYALGATFYNIITGELPFPGKTLRDILALQSQQKIPTLPELANVAPRELHELIRKMLAVAPEDRPASMAEVAGKLEQWLDRAGNRRAVSSQHTEILTKSAVAHAAARLPVLLRVLPMVGLLLMAVGVIAGAAMSRPSLAVGLLVALPSAVAGYGVLAAFVGGSYLFVRLRRYLLGLSVREWGEMLLGLGVFGLAIWLTGLMAAGVGGLVLGLVAGAGYWAVVRRGGPDLSEVTQAAGDVVRQLRLRGLDEPTVQDIVVQHGGRNWAPLFEQLFGYPALVEARQRLGMSVGLGGVRGPREWLIDWLEAREAARREQQERRQLAEAQARADSVVGSEHLKKAREELARQEAELKQRVAAVAAAAAERESQMRQEAEAAAQASLVQALLPPDSGVKPTSPTILPSGSAAGPGYGMTQPSMLPVQLTRATDAAKIRREADLKRNLEYTLESPEPAAAPPKRSLLVDVLLLPVRVLAGGLPRLLLGSALLALALGLQPPENFAVPGQNMQVGDAARQASEQLRALQEGGQFGVRLGGAPTANAVLAAGVLILSCVLRRWLPTLLVVAGSLAMWPGAWLLGSAGLPETLPEGFLRMQALLLGGLPVVAPTIFWPGLLLVLLGVVAMTLRRE